MRRALPAKGDLYGCDDIDSVARCNQTNLLVEEVGRGQPGVQNAGRDEEVQGGPADAKLLQQPRVLVLHDHQLQGAEAASLGRL